MVDRAKAAIKANEKAMREAALTYPPGKERRELEARLSKLYFYQYTFQNILVKTSKT